MSEIEESNNRSRHFATNPDTEDASLANNTLETNSYFYSHANQEDQEQIMLTKRRLQQSQQQITEQNQNDEQNTVVAKLMSLLPMSQKTPTGERVFRASILDIELAAFLAVQHFNQRNANSIVPQLSRMIDAWCPELQFQIELVDSLGSPFDSTKKLTAAAFSSKQGIPLAGIVGTGRSSTSLPTATLGGGLELPQISCCATSRSISPSNQPFFGRTAPTTRADAFAAATYMSQLLVFMHQQQHKLYDNPIHSNDDSESIFAKPSFEEEDDHSHSSFSGQTAAQIAILYIRDDYGQAYATDFQQEASRRYGVRVSQFPFEHGNQASIEVALQRIRDSELRYIFGIFFAGEMTTILSAAYRVGLVDADHVWFFSEALNRIKSNGFSLSIPTTSTIPDSRRTQEIDKDNATTTIDDIIDKNDDHWAVVQALNGSGIVLLDIAPNEALIEESVKFRENATLRQAYIDAHPDTYLQLNHSLIQEAGILSIFFSSTNYDAAMSLALGTCKSIHNRKQQQQQDVVGGSTFPTGTEIYKNTLSNVFEGASGLVELEAETASRSVSGLSFKVFNVIAHDPVIEGGDDGQDREVVVYFDAIETASIGFQSATFPDVATTTTLQPFVYHGGSTVPPAPLPPLVVYHHVIDRGMLIFGYTMYGLLVCMILGWMAWTWTYRDFTVVRSAQPLFLMVLCIGCLVLSSCIIPLSLQDDGMNHSQSLMGNGKLSQTSLNVACMATPYFISLGFTIAFAGLYSKINRINQLHRAAVHFKRILIRPRDVMIPFVTLLTINVGLLVAWTFSSPLLWVRIPVIDRRDRFGRFTETVGKCQADEDSSYSGFLWALVMINLISLIVCLVETYRNRKLPAEFKATYYIAWSVGCLVEAALLGFPVLWLVSDQVVPSSVYFVSIVLVVLFCCAILLPTFCPLVNALRRKRKLRRNSGRPNLASEVILSRYSTGEPFYPAGAARSRRFSYEDKHMKFEGSDDDDDGDDRYDDGNKNDDIDVASH